MSLIGVENLWWHKGFSFEEQITKLLSNNNLILENPEINRVDAVINLMNSKIYRKDAKKLIIIETFGEKELLSAPTEEILSVWLNDLANAACKFPDPNSSVKLVYSEQLMVHGGFWGFGKPQLCGITSNAYFVVFSGPTADSKLKQQIPLTASKIETGVSAKAFSFAITYQTTGGERKQFLAAVSQTVADTYVKALKEAAGEWTNFGKVLGGVSGKEEITEEDLRNRAASSPMKLAKSTSSNNITQKKDRRKSYFA